MYKIVFGKKFFKGVEGLDEKLQRRLKSSLDILAQDPFAPQLHSKPLTGSLAGYYSFRLGRDYRIIFNFIDQRKVQLFSVGHRKDVYE